MRCLIRIVGGNINVPSKLARYSLPGGGLRLPSTARVERGPSEGARSVSTEDIGGRPLFPPSSLALSSQGQSCYRCGHQSPVEVLAIAKRRDPFLRVAQPVRRSVRR